MTPDIDELLTDINKAAHAAGTNAWVRDVLQRAHRAVRDMREMSAVCESGCDRALEMLEVSADTCKKLTAELDRRREERIELDRRIHNQRVALRENWEIIEMRASHRRAWLQSPLLASMLRRGVKQSADAGQ